MPNNLLGFKFYQIKDGEIFLDEFRNKELAKSYKKKMEERLKKELLMKVSYRKS